MPAPASIATCRLPPHVEVMLCCGRATRDAAWEDRLVRLLSGQVDWERLVLTTCAHGMLPLVDLHLRQRCFAESVPTPVRSRVTALARRNAVRSIVLSTEQLRLLNVFAKHGVSAIPFKGPVLAALLYQDVTLRVSSDLDVLVRRSEVGLAATVLVANGFVQQHNRGLGTRTERRFSYNHVFEGRRVVIELHWALAPRSDGIRFDVDKLWNDASTVMLLGRAVPTPAPEALLLMLTVHGTRHGWERAKWLCDIAALISTSPRLDWSRAIDEAAGLGCQRMLFVGAGLAHALFGAEVPQPALDHVHSDAVARELIADVVTRLERDDSPPLPLSEKRLFANRARERTRDRLWFWIRRAELPPRSARHVSPLQRLVIAAGMLVTPNERDWEFLELPDRFRSLYCVVRLWRLLLHPARHRWRRNAG